MNNTYQCAACKETFEKGRDDAEAMAESVENFGAHPAEEMDIVCDDCFQKMTAILPIKAFMSTTI